MISLQGCGGGAGKNGNKVTLILGGYTTPREAYGKAIIPAFQKYWKDKTGQDVEFQESYNGSGAQSRQIIGGFEADIGVEAAERREEIRLPAISLRRDVLGTSLDPLLELRQRVGHPPLDSNRLLLAPPPHLQRARPETPDAACRSVRAP